MYVVCGQSLIDVRAGVIHHTNSCLQSVTVWPLLLNWLTCSRHDFLPLSLRNSDILFGTKVSFVSDGSNSVFH
jgi:hypothetical protein